MPTPQEPLSAPSRVAAGKYLTFQLGRESYGISVLKIREIIRLQPITRVPDVPDYVKGVINLRGRIIPVVDLRARFGQADIRDTETTCIMVVQVSPPDRAPLQMGLMVDAVEEVANIVGADIEPTPDFGVAAGTSCLLGMAKIKGTVKTLLDIDTVLVGDEWSRLNKL